MIEALWVEKVRFGTAASIRRTTDMGAKQPQLAGSQLTALGRPIG
jgi:hypothetical protein